MGTFQFWVNLIWKIIIQTSNNFAQLDRAGYDDDQVLWCRFLESILLITALWYRRHARWHQTPGATLVLVMAWNSSKFLFKEI